MNVVIVDREQQQSTYEVSDVQELFSTLGDEMKIDALCGGCCSCATCHVYLGDEYKHAVNEVAQDEQEILDGLMHAAENSRLLCQMTLQTEIEHLEITIAPAE
ncbi:2Fe-2S iron-sulfur cluster-binding protein [Zhongshania borealis]|uniref:2Fe-2S iron-sulfur cluster-binding protein n=1 Tax=Zhongshania borealis TaxID=889488 RepID=A0ABP7WSS5_9GAMM